MEISREYPPLPLVGVGALIVDGTRIVLVRRGAPPSQGEWSIPGGLVRVGETLLGAVVREALEETGLEVEPLNLVELVERIFPDENGRIQHHYVLADYLCHAVGGVIQAGSDTLEALWVEKEDLQSYGLATITMRVALKALRKL